ncbi:Asd/ArgC dimerization domain-containing protein [Candidatus Neptunochlamydia vexilliferae]|uniref:Asd/ArgC dimerization domain-containing protein n=1 Tax=Candidatus Neptunichlamydia vexilliferae TaxID=1651774 RepID=UPI001890C7D6|nr:Asd/ArgC dimerization domain-containing protein [Candidatus Neptunochlamydia vexilliferae]
MDKLSVGLLGGRGLVGQTYVKLLEEHPLFKLAFMPSREELPDVEKAKGCALIFSALPNEAAEKIDPLYAAAGFPVFASASCHRMNHPLIIPEINGAKLKELRGGFIVSKPNCTLQSMLLPLYPLHQRFTLKSIAVTFLQAISGAGAGFELEDNVLPFIAGEEEKCLEETRKILEMPTLPISVHCTRVPVSHGHLACISASFETKPTLSEVKEAWESFGPLTYREEEDRPQPHLDLGAGMEISLGRLRSCPLFDIRFTALSHNLIRGAAGGGLLTAQHWIEYAQASCSL